MNPPAANAGKLRLVVLISGGGTTLKNLLEKIAAGQLAAQIVLVISSNAKAAGLEIAAAAGIPTQVIAREVACHARSLQRGRLRRLPRSGCRVGRDGRLSDATC